MAGDVILTPREAAMCLGIDIATDEGRKAWKRLVARAKASWGYKPRQKGAHCGSGCIYTYEDIKVLRQCQMTPDKRRTRTKKMRLQVVSQIQRQLKTDGM